MQNSRFDKLYVKMNKIQFAIVLHFHQPIGNFEHIFERAFKSCYKPFMELLSGYPDIKMTIHVSGCLLDYFENKHPEILEQLKTMISRGQIEIIGGAYYEPILTAIPENDAIGQIDLMSLRIKEKFGLIPKGMWVPERVWNPELTKIISKAKIRYCVLDDTIIMKTGIDKENTGGYFLTGRGSQKIAVFPFDKKLRYSIPFKLPHETMDYMKELASKRANFLLVYSDDGEKFGEWKGTYEWVYEKEWLKDFFNSLRENSNWIELVNLSDYLGSYKPLDTIEIPEGSYDEMEGWAQGLWNNFLSKYPESKQMYVKSSYVSKKVKQLKRAAKKKDGWTVLDAEKKLYKGQCNCSYWHGLYGGLYFYHLRNAVYNYLIKAESVADEVLHKNKNNWLELKQIESGLDGKNEFVMENNSFSLYFDPDDGGVLRELDYRPLALNLINTLSRKKEPYHKISHSIDKYPRACLRDHFIKENLKREDFAKVSYEEMGDFDKEKYAITKKGKKLILKRKSKVYDTNLTVSKEIQIKSKNEILVSYHLAKNGNAKLDTLFGVEFNLTMPFLNADRYNYTCNGKGIGRLSSAGSVFGTKSFGIFDSLEKLKVSLDFSKESEGVWYFPVRTVLQSEGSYRRSYQASCILPRWKLDFGKSNDWDLKIRWAIE